MTGFHSIDWVSRKARGFIYVLPNHRRAGYGAEALTIRNSKGFKDMNLNRIEWAVATDNKPCRTMLSKVTKTHEGTIRDALFWGGQYHSYDLFATSREDDETT